MTENENLPENHDEEELIELYSDGLIASGNGAVPKWIHAVGIITLIWGIAWLYLYWNGSYGWFDRGYWGELQQAANTTYIEKPAKSKS